MPCSKGVITGDAATEQRRLKPGWLEQEGQGGDLLAENVAVSTPKTAERGRDWARAMAKAPECLLQEPF